MTRTCRAILLYAFTLCLFCILLTPISQASVFEHKDRVVVSRLHTIDDDMWVFSNDLLVEGTITGDALAFSYDVDLDGEVNGSVFSFSRRFSQTGAVDGSVRLAAESVRISGVVGRSLESIGGNFILNSGGVIGRDAWVAAGDIVVDGTIRGVARLRGQRIDISGTLEGDAFLKGDRIVISPPAVIQGNLTYQSDKEDALKLEPGVTVAGEVVWNPTEEGEGEGSGFSLTDFILEISSLLAAFLFGIIVTRIFRPYAEESVLQLQSRFGISIAVGTVSLFALVMCVTLLLLVLIAIVAGTIMVSGGEWAVLGVPTLVISILLLPITAFLSVSGAILMYSGKIAVALLIGGAMSRTRPGAEGRPPLRAVNLLLGLAVLTLIFMIPYVGWLGYLLASIIGAGSIVLGIRHCPRSTARGPINPAGASSGQETPPQS